MTRTQRVWLRPDGIIQLAVLAKEPQTLEDARENVAAATKVGGGVRRPVLLDTSVAAPLTREAQAYYTSADIVPCASALGLVVTTTLSRIVGNFVIACQRPEVPTRLFDSEWQAVQWLQGYLVQPKRTAV